MKNVFVVILLVSSVFSYGRNPQKEMEKKLIGTWCNPYTYEYSGELKGRCEAVNVPSLDLKSWEIKDGALIIKGFMTGETGEKEEYETIERILKLNDDTLRVVSKESSPRVTFMYMNAKVIKERITPQVQKRKEK
mgnify:CR=1 FL=1